MMNWLRKLEQIWFSPPHTFESVFALVALTLALDIEVKQGIGASNLQKEETPSKARQF
jgi:hypothetical protein